MTINNIATTKSTKTPNLNFDAKSGVLTIKDHSIPENSVEFYKPTLE